MAERYTRDELLDQLTSLADEVRRPPTVRDMREAEDYPSPRTYQKRFGSWNAAKREANLPTFTSGAEPTDQELIEDLKQVDQLLDGEVTAENYGEVGGYGRQTYIRHFGSWNEAKKEAGLEPLPGGPGGFTDEELLDMLQDLDEEKDKELRTKDIDEAESLPSSRTYRQRFGSWKEIREKAGLGN